MEAGESAGRVDRRRRSRAPRQADVAVARKRLWDAFTVAGLIGPHRIRSDLVKAARAVPDDAVRAKLAFKIAALLRQSRHPGSEVVETFTASGVSRADATRAAEWAAKNRAAA